MRSHGSPFLSVLDILEFTLYALDAASGRGIGYLCRVPRGAVRGLRRGARKDLP